MLTTREVRNGSSTEIRTLNGERRRGRYSGFMANVHNFLTSRHHCSNEDPFLQQDQVKVYYRTRQFISSFRSH
jgi:hypothetical protein